MKLGLGTAQFGMEYGITNKVGQCSEAEVEKILLLAEENKIDTLDTATAYGDSEIILGRCLSRNHSFKIVTKIPSLKNINKQSALEWLESTLVRLKQDRIHAVLFHDADDILNEQGIHFWEELYQLKKAGYFEKLGVSVYDPVQLRNIVENFPIEIFQAPFNIIDQRFIRDNYLNDILDKKIEVHARSIFLQGLLLAKSMCFPNTLKKLQDKIQLFHKKCEEKSINFLTASLKFLKNELAVDRLVVGVTLLSEFKEILIAYKEIDDLPFDFSEYFLDDPALIDPRYWKRNGICQ